jgi:hypothetical protein
MLIGGDGRAGDQLRGSSLSWRLSLEVVDCCSVYVPVSLPLSNPGVGACIRWCRLAATGALAAMAVQALGGRRPSGHSIARGLIVIQFQGRDGHGDLNWGATCGRAPWGALVNAPARVDRRWFPP